MNKGRTNKNDQLRQSNQQYNQQAVSPPITYEDNNGKQWNSQPTPTLTKL